MTGSAVLLGVVAFSNQLPTFFLAALAGVVADRWDRKRLLICTQSLSILQAIVLLALVLMNATRTWQIAALSVFAGIASAFDTTVRQSFVVEMVDKREDLGNAIAFNSAMFKSARFISPPAAGTPHRRLRGGHLLSSGWAELHTLLTSAAACISGACVFAA